MEKIDKSNPKMISLSHFMENSKKNSRKILLLGITGFDSKIFSIPIISNILSKKVNLMIIISPQAAKFISEDEIYNNFVEAQKNNELIVFTDKDEWDFWKKSAIVLHIYIRNSANYLLISPMCANTLAKLANGMCDDLLVFL